MDTHVNTTRPGPGPMNVAGRDQAPGVPGLVDLAAPGTNAQAHWVPAHVATHSKMRESADIAKIAPALVRAQAAMESPPRNRSVQVRTQAGSYTFRYATLDKITDMTRGALAENGLCVLQPIVNTERGAALVTRLLHESGQWMECEIALPALGNSPQAFGSIVTYVRRYAISALLNISADEDDDANRAAGNHYADVPARAEGKREQARLTPPQRDHAGAAPKGDPEPGAHVLANRTRAAEGASGDATTAPAKEVSAPSPDQSAPAQPRQAGGGARPSARPRKDEARPASVWAILRPGKDAITAPDGPAWLKWWQDRAAQAASEDKVEALQSLYEANVPAWDRIATHSAEGDAVVAEAVRAVKDVLEA